ncbi:MAG: glycosyltransferase [Candidatus Hydrogenedentes bacterium]|nr:glycosyltransferase [Candidatus Hydrogenedentota bacterium]
MNNGIDISIVVCTYNRAALLFRSVESLFRLNTAGAFVYEIVVIDDLSTDDTPVILEGLRERSPVTLRWARASGAGIAAARNCGIREAVGDYIAYFDDDQLADPNWLLELWRTRLDTHAACVGGARLLELPARELSGIHPIIRLYLGEIPIETSPRKCGRADLLCTGTVLLDRTVFTRVGGFDESLSEGGEDTEFFTRVRAAGFQCWYTPHSVVKHIIPSYRREAPYLQWTAIRGGECFACRDLRELGALRTVVLSALRVIHAFAVHAPVMCVMRLLKRKGDVLARSCQIRRALAYARGAVRRIITGNSERGGKSRIDFRSERTLFPRTES